MTVDQLARASRGVDRLIYATVAPGPGRGTPGARMAATAVVAALALAGTQRRRPAPLEREQVAT